MKPLSDSFKHAWNGLKAAWREERSFRIQIIISIIVLIAIRQLGLGSTDTALLVFAIMLVLMAEILNTAIEDLCNKLEPRPDPVIGKVKDLSAAFVLVAAVGAAIVGLIVLYNYV